MVAQRVPVRDDVVPAHRLVGRPLRLVVAADEHPCGHLPAQGGRPVDGLRDPPGLVRGQRVHRIDEDGLNPGRSGSLPAVVQDGVEEALRLARAGARGDDRRPPGAGGQARERSPLMAVRRKPERHVWKRLTAFRRLLERQRDGEVRALREVVGIGQEVADDAGECGVGRPEAGGEEVAERAGDLGRDDGGYQESSPSSLSKRGSADSMFGLPMINGGSPSLPDNWTSGSSNVSN